MAKIKITADGPGTGPTIVELTPEEMATELQKSVERLVDRDGLYDVVIALRNTCELKAERLGHAGRQWAKAAKRVEALYRALQHIRGIN
jgi:hypothetical protein